MNYDEIIKKIAEFEEEIAKLSYTLKELKELVGQRDNIPMQKVPTKKVPEKSSKIVYDPDEFDIGEDGILYEYLGEDKDVVIPDGVWKIGAEVFSGREEIETVEIPDSVTEIGDKAFYFCRGIKEIRLSDNIEKIGDWAFYNCINIERIRLSDNIKKIGKFAFMYCNNLLISVPDKCECGKNAFEHCFKVIYRGR